MIHGFDVEVAREYGIPSAILLQQISEIIHDNEQNKTDKVDGKVWMIQGSRELAKRTPYFTDRTIRRLLSSLIESGLLQKSETGFYALTDKAMSMAGQNVPGVGQIDPIVGQNVPPAQSQSGQGFEHTSTSYEDAETEEPRVYI